MKMVGTVRKIDNLGRLVIPKEIRDTNGWKEGQSIEMIVKDNGLFLRAYMAKEQRMNDIKTLEQVLEKVQGTIDPALEQKFTEVIEKLDPEI